MTNLTWTCPSAVYRIVFVKMLTPLDVHGIKGDACWAKTTTDFPGDLEPAKELHLIYARNFVVLPRFLLF